MAQPMTAPAPVFGLRFETTDAGHRVLSGRRCAASSVIASAQQGRVFKVDRDGVSVLKTANTQPGTNDTNRVPSEMPLPPRLL